MIDIMTSKGKKHLKKMKVDVGIDILDYVHRIGNRACARRIYRPSV